MELVYLWVEKYKNIEKQGFHFSPRFKCVYDEGANELTIDENKDHQSIFPDNINITAIVGRNGSGKSSLQKLIFFLIFYAKYSNKGVQEREKMIDDFINYWGTTKNIFLIINTEQGFKSIFLNDEPSLKNISITKYENEEIDFYSIHFNYMIDTWCDDLHDNWVNNVYHKADGYETPLLLEPYKGHQADKSYIDISNIEYLNNQKMYDLSKLDNNNNVSIVSFQPNKLWARINSEKLQQKIKRFKETNKAGFKMPQENGEIEELLEKIKKSQSLTKDDFEKINLLYALLKIKSSKSSIFVDNTIQQLSSISGLKTKIEQEEDIFKNSNEPAMEKIKVCIDCHTKLQDIKDKDIEKLNEILMTKKNQEEQNKQKPRSIKEIRKALGEIEKLPAWLALEFYQDNKSYSSLSSGEKAFTNFAINLKYQIKNVASRKSYNTINLFLDEVEFSLHPDWQKRFVNETIKILEDFNKNLDRQIQFNVYFATHSPFILSDIPKENVMFLNEGKQVSVDIETFGANIHTLLAHGFFMQDGLMGEFAKNEIDKVIALLNKLQLNAGEIKQCENIIKLIGEPIIKRQLQKMLASKRLVKIDSIDKKIKDLEYELDVLKKYQNKPLTDELKDRGKRKYIKKKKDN